MLKLAVVVPTYKEAGTIQDLVARLRQSVPQALIFIVDDASPDGTAAKAEALGDANLYVIRRASKQGIGSAYKEGFARALSLGADLVAQMDADLSHDPADLVRFLAESEDADVIIGSRYIPGGRIVGWGPWRHFCSRSAMLFARAVLRVPVRDITSGYRLWRADALTRVLSAGVSSEGYAFQEEMLYRAAQAGQRLKEVPIVFKDRRIGQSKLGWRDVREFFHVMLRLKFRK